MQTIFYHFQTFSRFQAKDMLLSTLQSSVTQLKNVCPEHVSHYYKDLLSAKEAKVEGALNRVRFILFLNVIFKARE